MATPSAPPNQQPHASTPFQSQTDPASSPSISNNPPPQPPPPMLPYASINQQSYPSNSPSGPSNYPSHSPYMYNQAYYPQQPPPQARHTQSVPYNSGMNRYNDQYQHQPHYPPVYQPNIYGGYPNIPMGAGGPGPTTLQHGYGGYPSDVYQNSPYAGYPPNYPVQPDSLQHFPPQHNPLDGNDFTHAQHNAQHVPHNFAPSHDQQQPSHTANGPVPPTQHQAFQPSYPPDHPYAFGVGVGYQNYTPTPLPYNGGYPGYGSGFIPPVAGGRMGSGKGLNPAAQGFSYPSSHAGSRSNSQPSSAPIQNGNSTPSSTSLSEQKPTFPSIAPVTDDSNSTPLPNGHTQVKQAWKPPVIVDGEKLKGIGGEQPSSEASQGLGLTTEKPRSPSPQSPNANLSASTITTRSASTPAVSSAPTASTSPTSVETPRQTDGDPSYVTSPKSGTSSRVQPDAGWTFGGEALAGLTSPPAGTASRNISGPSTRSASGSIAKKKSSTYSTQTGPLQLSAARPVAESSSGNTYALSLRKLIPSAVETKEVTGEQGSQQKTSAKGKEKASGKKVIFAAGAGSKASRIINDHGEPLVFGETTDEDREAAARPSESQPVSEDRSEEVQPAASTSKPETEAPRTKPVAKASSWAAAVRGPSSTAGSSVPTAAQSKVASPARSTVSLAPESEAGPSRMPSSPSANATPPRSSTSSSQPPPSTGASTTTGPRPAFNYAAAAATGASLTPQEDLARLLADGVKGKGKEGQATIPRGLINTGNMCFANTILQVLVYCSPFTELFEELGKRLKADLARRTPLLEAMIIFLREFNAPFPAPGTATPNGNATNGTSTPKGKGRDSTREAFIPENVYDAMKENKRFDSMRRGHQEDAEEYLGFFLNTLHEEILLLLSRTQSSRTQAKTNGSSVNGDEPDRQIERPISPGAGDDAGWLEVGKKQKTHVVRNTETRESAITRLFGGTLRSLLHTPGQKDSVTLEPYQPLQLDIQAPNVLDISDALKHIAEPEIVPGVWSAARGANVDATKQVYIESCPQILILHLKRFVYDPVERAVVKRNKPVGYGAELVIPLEIISPGRRNPSGIKYRLFGVVYHHGVSASGGHYTVSVARQDDKGWIHFDDESVTNVPKEDVVVSREEVEGGKTGLVGGREKTAYLLFYQRVR
nr:uncharacterized protein CI109_007505 [Kwoniella shandongensis]KAA5524183.1 hypothetical protein CI109_007505 [Kwoniella shandongensis]